MRDRLGAWAVVFCAPPGGHSTPGLRYLQHQLAQLICGPLLLHDLDADPAGVALQKAFEFLFDPSPHAFPVSPVITLFCPPDWDREPSTQDAAQARQLVDKLTLKGQLQPGFLDKGAPLGLSALQRALEGSVARLDPKIGGAEREGAEEALRFTASVLAKHLGKLGG
jgi:hypothetical protein